MKVTAVASPHQVQDLSTPDHVRTAKALQAFNTGKSSYDKAPAQSPVLDQNNIGVEELGAITQTKKSDKIPESEGSEGVEQLAAVEETQDTPPAKPAVDPAVSRQFAQIARQTKEVRLAQQQLKAEKAALAAERAALEGKPAPSPDLTNYIDRSRLTSDPLSVLAEAGISYDTLTQQLLNQQPTDPRVQATISKLEAKIASLEQANESSAKSYTENQQNAYNAAVKQIRVDAKKLVFTDPAFETIKATSSVDDVVELITETYNKDGVLLSVEDAAQQVEDYLVEEATKLANLSKIQKRLQANRTASATNQAKQPQNAQQTKQPQGMKTLTNASSGTQKLSMRDRAIAAMEGRLK